MGPGGTGASAAAVTGVGGRDPEPLPLVAVDGCPG